MSEKKKTNLRCQHFLPFLTMFSKALFLKRYKKKSGPVGKRLNHPCEFILVINIIITFICVYISKKKIIVVKEDT